MILMLWILFLLRIRMISKQLCFEAMVGITIKSSAMISSKQTTRNIQKHFPGVWTNNKKKFHLNDKVLSDQDLGA